jgi:hypothetical protein
MHANVQRRKRQTNGRDRIDDDSAGEYRQFQVDLRQGPGGARNADGVFARVARFDPNHFRSTRVAVQAVQALQAVIVVVILNGSRLHAVVVMAVAV